MARGNSNNESAEAADTGTQPAANAEAADSRFIKVNLPAGHPSGLSGEQKRVDVIRELAKTGNYTRGEIKKMINDLGGKPISYQIVFQATRGIPNVKKAQRGESAAEGPAAAEAESSTADAVEVAE